MSDFVHGSAVDEAQARIDRWLDEYGKGISNRRREAVDLAQAAGLERGEVETLFDDVDALAKAGALAAEPEVSFKNPAIQPEGATITKHSLTGEAAPAEVAKRRHAEELEAAITLVQAEPADAAVEVAAPAVVTRPAPSPLLKGFEEMPAAPSPPPGASADERLTYPPGLLGHATDRAFRSTDLPDRQIALWGAMVGLAKILDRRLIGPTRSSSVLYNLLVAATGAGKEPAQQFSLTLLRAAGPGYERLLQGGFLASAQAVEDMVRVTPNCLAMIDEFGSWFKMIQDQSGNVSQLPMVLCKLWGQKPHGRYPVLRRANRDAKEEDLTFIQWPTMALAGATISEPFWDACGDDHISGGFLNRCLLLDAGLGAMEYVTPTYEPDDIPEWMVKLIQIAAKSAQPSQGSLPIMTGYLAPWQQSWDPRGEEAYKDRRSDIRRYPKAASGRCRSVRTRWQSATRQWSRFGAARYGCPTCTSNGLGRMRPLLAIQS